MPVLFLSGEQDELVPLQMMQKLYEVSDMISRPMNDYSSLGEIVITSRHCSLVSLQECQSPQKKVALFADGQHNTTWLSRDYTNQIRKFLDEVRDPRSPDEIHSSPFYCLVFDASGAASIGSNNVQCLSTSSSAAAQAKNELD